MKKIKTILKNIYNRILRHRLPHKISVHNGVPVEDHARLFDFSDTVPDHEAELIAAIRTQVREDNKVTLIGGGLGVSTVAAAEATGRRGTVETYEGSAKQYSVVKNTVNLNQAEDCINVNHAIVGSYLDFSSKKYGVPGNAEIVKPAALPKSDVLVLDCEGAEIEILSNISYRPRVIIVESHGFLDAPEEDIKEILLEKGYEITNRRVESESSGIVILTAVQPE